MDYKAKLAELLQKHVKGDVQLAVPPDPSLGDYALPCFPFAKEMKKNPIEIANELKGKIRADFIDRIETKGPYLNFFLKKDMLAEDTITKILKEHFGKGREKKERVMVEFSQANTHKAFHVGHIRGTSLGESLARILKFNGKDVVRANYQGDTGMHVAKWLWCYKRFHSKTKIKQDESWFASIYVDAVRRLSENEKLQEEVDKINKALEEKSDKKLVDLWKKTRKICLESMESIYKELNTKFDHYFFESQVEERGKEISKELVKKKIAGISEEATIMDLKKHNLGVWVLLRKDGTVLYSAKDLALAEQKFTKYKIDTSIYVVGKEQEFHFMQLFKTLELMKFRQAKNCRYVPVSLVKLPHGKMSSRTGDNILYSSFKEELMEEAKKEIAKRYKLTEKEAEKRALAIAIASMKYSMLKQHPNKEIVFVKEEAMRFDGDTGPYLLYSYARASSILRKAGEKKKNKEIAPTEKEAELIKALGDFPEKAEQAAEQLSPAILANYAFSLAQKFNEFYTQDKVIGSEEESFRLKLVEAFRIVLKNSLNLLGIETIEEM